MFNPGRQTRKPHRRDHDLDSVTFEQRILENLVDAAALIHSDVAWGSVCRHEAAPREFAPAGSGCFSLSGELRTLSPSLDAMEGQIVQLGVITRRATTTYAVPTPSACVAAASIGECLRGPP